MRNTHRFSNILPAAAAVVLLPFSAIAFQESLPAGEKIMDSYVEATGGITAYDRVENRVVKSTLEIAGAGVKISITTYQAKPNKAYSVLDSTMTGKIENGTDGEVVWDLSSMAGAQIKEGKERALALHLNSFDRLAYWRRNFAGVETMGAEQVEGRPCYVVRATPKEAPAQTLFFDQETHLLTRMKMDAETQAGTIPMDSSFSDYQPADGVLIPRKVTVKVMGQVRTVTVESLEQNVPLPEDCFSLPAEIKAVVDKTR